MKTVTGFALFSLLLCSLALSQILPFGPVFKTSCGSPVSTNLKGWYSADCITLTGAVCSFPADGATFGIIAPWADRSSNANNILADSNFHGCVFHTNQINGLPAVQFSNNCGFGFSSTPDTGATSWSVFAVFKNSSTSYKGDFTGGSTTSGATGVFKYWTGTTKQQGVDKANLVGVASGTASQDLNWHQTNVRFENQSAGNTVVLRIDRASDGPSSFTSANMNTGINFIGIGHENGSYQEALDGKLAEILLYAGTGTLLSSGDITTNETYLNCRYGL